jgi:hypothetical protein
MNEGNGKSKKGTNYDVSIPTEVEGKTKWTRVGNLFVNDGGERGVLFLDEKFLTSSPKIEDGQIRIPVFKHRPKAAKAPEGGKEVKSA